eukprot:6204978-Pleurochrysis_carterae.AAC.2
MQVLEVDIHVNGDRVTYQTMPRAPAGCLCSNSVCVRVRVHVRERLRLLLRACAQASTCDCVRTRMWGMGTCGLATMLVSAPLHVCKADKTQTKKARKMYKKRKRYIWSEAKERASGCKERGVGRQKWEKVTFSVRV